MRARSDVYGRPKVMSAFTLLELLLVMSLITALLGATGFAISGSGRGAALQAAQHLIANNFRRVSETANVRQTRARLVINADGDNSECFLREIQVVYEWPIDSERWQTVGGSGFIPLGVAVVPPTVAPERLVAGLNWPSGDRAPISRLLGPTLLTVTGTTACRCYFIELGPTYSLSPLEAQIAVASVRSVVDGLAQFDNVSAVRGVRIRANGAVTLLDDARDF